MVPSVGGSRLPGYVRSLLAEVIEKTWYPVAIAATATGIDYDSQLAMATPAQPFHKLVHSTEYEEFSLHFIVNATMKILRVWDVPPSQRLLPAYDAGRRLPREDEDELHRKLGPVYDEVVNDLSRFLYGGIVKQVTSMPMDIRVERDIAKKLPEHHAAQQAYLGKQVQDLEPHFAPEIASVAPSKVYAASSAMNIVLAEEAAEMTGVKPRAMFRRSPHRGLGERLREELHAVTEAGYRGDLLAAERWTAMLGLAGWYEWRGLDTLP